MALKRHQCHLAGSHLLNDADGVYNRQALRDNLQGEPMLLVRLVDREQGLIVAPGNPLDIHDIADLAREDVRFINRQRGSGTRVLLDYRLKQLGIRPQQLAGYEDEEYTHMNVAAAVLSGRAHTGLAVRAAACALGLDFVPVGVEEYDLVIPQRYAEDERILALLDVIRSEAFAGCHPLRGLPQGSGRPGRLRCGKDRSGHLGIRRSLGRDRGKSSPGRGTTGLFGLPPFPRRVPSRKKMVRMPLMRAFRDKEDTDG